MIKEEFIFLLKKEVNELEVLVHQSNSKQENRIMVLNILIDIKLRLKSQNIELNEFDAIASTLIRNFDLLREFVVGNKCRFSKLESCIMRISKLRSSVKDYSK
jgi:hypothetical protein